jgi:hypothetical protein
MPEISRSQTLRDNERIKHWTSALAAWGNALVIGGFGKMVVDQKLELVPCLGIIGGIVVLWMGSVILTMLVAEGEI